MNFPTPTIADWRALVEKELAGKSFEKTLVHPLAEGLAVAPLYAEAKAEATAARGGAGFLVCVASDDAAELADGADALWVTDGDVARLLAETTAPLVADGLAPAALAGAAPDRRVLLGHDPLAHGAAPETLAPLARALADRPGAVAATVSTLAWHEAGADAADELAFALSAGAAYVGALVTGGLAPDAAAAHVSLRVAVGRDTFLELAKLRALRVVWQKLLAAFGASGRPLVHAVASRRTLAARDPWVNMLRVTTQVFAAAAGGADLVTPLPFDAALGEPSALGRRVARNTGLVLREESFLGRIQDPAGGSYYLETLTDELAREAWKRFRALEAEGGIAAQLADGRLAARLAKAWDERLARLATRRLPLLGVSEFANLDETLPVAVAPATPATGPLPAHRDSEAFEALRDRADRTRPDALLLTVGTFAESRARVGFTTSLLAAGGIRVRESATPEPAAIAVVCGSDERYVESAVAAVRALKDAGAKKVLLAGRPGALETDLRAAGLDGALFVGCDVVALLSDLLGSHLLGDQA